MNSEEYGFKICVIGDGGVGKTSLIKKYTQGTFEKDYIKTIGAQFSHFTRRINGVIINLIFWDIAGQDFEFLHPLFYKDSKACIVVYSLEETALGRDSFSHIHVWCEEFDKYCKKIPMILFANKMDLIEEEKIDKAKLVEIKDSYQFLDYYLTSVKTGQGVMEAFNAVIDELYNNSQI